MALTYSEQKQISKRYAQAGFELALGAKEVSTTLDALSSLAQALEAHADLARAVHNPLLDPKALSAAFDGLLNAAKAPKSAKQLVGALVENGRAATLPHVAQAFQALADADDGVTRGELISATPLDDKAVEQIANALGKKMILSARTDESLIGGLRIRLGSRMIDASVAGQLARLKKHLTQPMSAEKSA